MSRLTESIRLPAECMITAIPEHHAALKAAMSSNAAVTIDLTDVVKFDLTLIQLLVSAAKTAHTLEKGFELINCSDDFATSLQQAGVTAATLHRPVSTS